MGGRQCTLWQDIARYQPLCGGWGSYLPLPQWLAAKKAVVNVKNKDDHCLRFALRSALFLARDHVDRPQSLTLRPEQALGAQALLRALSSWVQKRTCWRSTDPSVEGLGRPQSGWRCRRRGKTSSPSRTTINNSQPPSSSMPTLRLSLPRFRAPNWTL